MSYTVGAALAELPSWINNLETTIESLAWVSETQKRHWKLDLDRTRDPPTFRVGLLGGMLALPFPYSYILTFFSVGGGEVFPDQCRFGR